MTYRLGICCSILLSYGIAISHLAVGGMNMKHLIGLFLGITLVACGAKSPIDSLQPGEEARVVRILDGDTFALSTGQVVKLASVEAPSFGRGDDQDAVYAVESARLLEDLIMGREVKLYYPGLTRDRYDRAIAHVATADNLGADFWVNQEIIRRGGARVRIYPDSAAVSQDLFAAEAEARRERAGLWSKRAYSDRSADAINAEYRGFAVIEGISLGAPGPGGAYAACRISLEGTAMLLNISDDAARHCQLQSGTKVRARGYVRNGRMEITHPLNLTRLDQSS